MKLKSEYDILVICNSHVPAGYSFSFS